MEIVLKCPHKVENERIQKFLKRKWFWMNTQLKFFEKVHRKEYKREYVSGESFLYLGRQYKLVVKRAKKDNVRLLRGVLLVESTKSVRDGSHTKKLIDQWFKERYETVFKERFEEMKKKFDYKKMPILKIRNMSRRWGSFLNKEQVALNPKLIHAPKDCIDYVIIHELCHMRYKNHNKKFWDLLEKKHPKWQKVKDKLEFRFGIY